MDRSVFLSLPVIASTTPINESAQQGFMFDNDARFKVHPVGLPGENKDSTDISDSCWSSPSTVQLYPGSAFNTSPTSIEGSEIRSNPNGKGEINYQSTKLNLARLQENEEQPQASEISGISGIPDADMYHQSKPSNSDTKQSGTLASKRYLDADGFAPFAWTVSALNGPSGASPTSPTQYRNSWYVPVTMTASTPSNEPYSHREATFPNISSDSSESCETMFDIDSLSDWSDASSIRWGGIVSSRESSCSMMRRSEAYDAESISPRGHFGSNGANNVTFRDPARRLSTKRVSISQRNEIDGSTASPAGIQNNENDWSVRLVYPHAKSGAPEEVASQPSPHVIYQRKTPSADLRTSAVEISSRTDKNAVLAASLASANTPQQGASRTYHSISSDPWHSTSHSQPVSATALERRDNSEASLSIDAAAAPAARGAPDGGVRREGRLGESPAHEPDVLSTNASGAMHADLRNGVGVRRESEETEEKLLEQAVRCYFAYRDAGGPGGRLVSLQAWPSHTPFATSDLHPQV